MSLHPDAPAADLANTQSHRFFRVGRLIPDDQEVVTIRPDTKVREALSLMKARDFSQLPVTVSGRVIGVFTYRSLAQGLGYVRRNDDPLEQPVEDLCEELHFVRASDEVGTVLAHLEADGAVLLGDEDEVRAVATTADVTLFLWGTTRPFVLLQDVELAVRNLMCSACSSDELHRAILHAHLSEEREPLRLEDLTLGQLLNVLLNDSNFGSIFRTVFGRNRDIVRSMLEPVREVRNKIFHFRDDVTAEELEVVASTVTWLRRKMLIRDGVQQ